MSQAAGLVSGWRRHLTRQRCHTLWRTPIASHQPQTCKHSKCEQTSRLSGRNACFALQADKSCGRPRSLYEVPDERCSQRHSGGPANWEGSVQDTKTTN